VTGRTGIVDRRTVLTCGACGARFETAAGGTYRLARCDPRAVARARGLTGAAACAECIPCLVGRILTQDEWARACATIHEPQAVAVELPSGGAEATIGVSEPVFRELEEPSYRGSGTLTVTTRRLVYTHDDRVWEVALEDVTEVAAAPPGFRLDVRGVPHPVYFFPPVGDRIADVIRRAASR
jgi:hypothetical protein